MSTFAQRLAAAPIWAPLASVLLAAAWLIPNTSPPWVAFHKDFGAGLVFGLVAVTLCMRHWRARRA